MRKTPFKKLDHLFLERHSPHAFKSDPVPEEDLLTILEAARWSPSCYNEQPWFFAYATKPEALQKFQKVLVEANWAWASKAPVLIIAFAKKTFARNGNPNRWASFDTGSAWMSMAMQAKKLGYATRAMGGFRVEEAHNLMRLSPDEYEAMAVIALGKEGKVTDLSKGMQEKEFISERNELKSMIFEIS